MRTYRKEKICGSKGRKRERRSEGAMEKERERSSFEADGKTIII